MNKPIPNADLIRAVLDGKVVQYRDKHSKNWLDSTLNPMLTIHYLAAVRDDLEFRLKPERIEKWCSITRVGDNTNSSYVVVRGHTERPPSHLNHDKVLRIEFDPDTLEVIQARTEEP